MNIHPRGNFRNLHSRKLRKAQITNRPPNVFFGKLYLAGVIGVLQRAKLPASMLLNYRAPVFL